MTTTHMPKQNLGGKRAWIILVCAATFYFYQFIIRVFPAVMDKELMQAFSIDATGLGWLSSTYYIAYVSVLIPLGVLMDRVGPRRLLTLAGFMCAMGCGMFSFATGFWMPCVARFLMGLGAACGFLGCLKLGTLWFRPRHMGKVIAVTLAFGTTGAMFGGAPLELLNNTVGWHVTLQILGLTGLLISGLIFTFVRDGPPGNKLSNGVDEHVFSGLVQVLLTPQVWFLALFGMLMYVPMVILGDLWGVGFVEKYYGIDQKVAASVVAAMWIGAAVGSPIFTTLSDEWARRRSPMILCVIGALVVHCLVFLVDGIPLLAMYVLFFLIGLFYTGKALTFASVTEIIPRSASGVAIGVTNMVVMTSGIVAHPLVGWLVDHHWDGAMIEVKDALVPLYSIHDYRFGLSILPISMVLSFLLLQVIRETHPAFRGPKRFG
ncbi:MAG: MFS transporter [Pseudomonadota bacterium]